MIYYRLRIGQDKNNNKQHNIKKYLEVFIRFSFIECI